MPEFYGKKPGPAYPGTFTVARCPACPGTSAPSLCPASSGPAAADPCQFKNSASICIRRPVIAPGVLYWYYSALFALGGLLGHSTAVFLHAYTIAFLVGYGNGTQIIRKCPGRNLSGGLCVPVLVLGRPSPSAISGKRDSSAWGLISPGPAQPGRGRHPNTKKTPTPDTPGRRTHSAG
jgi:hypothetical protein